MLIRSVPQTSELFLSKTMFNISQPRSQGFSLLRGGGREEGKSPGNEVEHIRFKRAYMCRSVVVC